MLVKFLRALVIGVAAIGGVIMMGWMMSGCAPSTKYYNCDMQGNCTPATPPPPTPTPKPDPNNTFRDEYGDPAKYLGTVDGCRVYLLKTTYWVYLARCSSGHATTMHYTGGKSQYPVQTI